MKISLLPIIAGAMTVVAQSSNPSPFKQISNALEEADSVLATFNGSPATTVAGLAALAQLQTRLDVICAAGIVTPIQPPDIQQIWLQDGKDLLDVVNATVILVVGKKSIVEGTLGPTGDTLAKTTLTGYRSQISPCLDLYRTAFDDTEGQQETIDAFEAQGLALIDAAIQAYSN